MGQAQSKEHVMQHFTTENSHPSSSLGPLRAEEQLELLHQTQFSSLSVLAQSILDT